MLSKTRGIIFHVTPYAEKNLIVKIYTEFFGLQSYITYSRSKRSKIKPAFFQPLSLVDLVVEQKSTAKLQKIREISIDLPFHSIPFDTLKSSIVLFLNEVLYKSIKEEEANTKLFHFICYSLKILDVQTDHIQNFHLLFMIQLSKLLGFYPQGLFTNETPFFNLSEGNFEKQSPAHSHFLDPVLSKIFSSFLSINYENLKEITISNTIRKQLLEKVIEYFALHISSFRNIKSHEVLSTVMK